MSRSPSADSVRKALRQGRRSIETPFGVCLVRRNPDGSYHLQGPDEARKFVIERLKEGQIG